MFKRSCECKRIAEERKTKNGAHDQPDELDNEPDDEGHENDTRLETVERSPLGWLGEKRCTKGTLKTLRISGGWS